MDDACLLAHYQAARLTPGLQDPVNTPRWNNDVSMLGQRRRRWANIKTLLFQRVVFAGEGVHQAACIDLLGKY